MVHFEIRFGPVPLLKRSKVRAWILPVIPKVSTALMVFALSKAISASTSKAISVVVITSSDDGYSWILH